MKPTQNLINKVTAYFKQDNNASETPDLPQKEHQIINEIKSKIWPILVS